jgi:transcription initiation factor TFIIIB Brf1 subunit/transcription initiation factor TFIIB
MKAQPVTSNEQILTRLLIDIVLSQQEKENYLASFIVWDAFQASIYASRVAAAISRASIYLNAIAKDDYDAAKRVVEFLNLPESKI